MKSNSNSRNFIKNIALLRSQNPSTLTHRMHQTGQIYSSSRQTSEQFSFKATHRGKYNLSSARKFLRFLSVLFARRLRTAWKNISQYAFYESDSSIPVNPAYPFHFSLNDNFVEKTSLAEALQNFQSAVISQTQKRKVYAFIKLKLLLQEGKCSKSLELQYQELKVEALEATVMNAFERMKARLFKKVLILIKRIGMEEISRRYKSRFEKPPSATIQKTKSASVSRAPQSTGFKQIIYVMNEENIKRRQKTEGVLSKSKQSFIKVPLMTEGVEISKIDIIGSYTPEKYKQDKLSSTTITKKRPLRIVDFNSQVTRSNEKNCKDCRFCRQNQTLNQIQKKSAEKRRTFNIQSFNFRKQKKMVRI